jgi:hypothetical protein
MLLPTLFAKRSAFILSGLWLAGQPALAQIQAPAAQPLLPTALYQQYQYTAYTVYDTSSPDPPTEVNGVGGTLTLRSDGTYEKHLSIVAPSGPYYFNQKGTFILTGDSIRFAFTDLKGSDVQRGIVRLDSTAQHLTLTIFGYPTGNQGVYQLVAAPAQPAVGPVPPTARPAPRKKRRR